MFISEQTSSDILAFIEGLDAVDVSDWQPGDTVVLRVRCGANRSVARTLVSGLSIDRDTVELADDIVRRLSGYSSTPGTRYWIEAMRRAVEKLEDGRAQTRWVPLDHIEVATEPDARDVVTDATWAQTFELRGIEALSRAVVSMAHSAEERANAAWAASINFAEKATEEQIARVKERAAAEVEAAQAAGENRQTDMVLQWLAPHLPALIATLATFKPAPKPAPVTEGDEGVVEPSPIDLARVGSATLADAIRLDPAVAGDPSVVANLGALVPVLPESARAMLRAILDAPGPAPAAG